MLGYEKKRGGGRKLTIVLCEAQGGCYTLHLLCWHASNALSDYSLSHLMKIAIESPEALLTVTLINCECMAEKIKESLSFTFNH